MHRIAIKPPPSLSLHRSICRALDIPTRCGSRVRPCLAHSVPAFLEIGEAKCLVFSGSLRGSQVHKRRCPKGVREGDAHAGCHCGYSQRFLSRARYWIASEMWWTLMFSAPSSSFGQNTSSGLFPA